MKSQEQILLKKLNTELRKMSYLGNSMNKQYQTNWFTAKSKWNNFNVQFQCPSILKLEQLDFNLARKSFENLLSLASFILFAERFKSRRGRENF